MSRVKIVATIGPRTVNPTALRGLRDAGMDVARLNGSHADLNWHAATSALLRHIIPEVPILLDIPGRKIRVKQLKHEPTFTAGDTVVLTTEDGYDGHSKVPVTNPDRLSHLKPGDVIFADDGTLRFTVVEVNGRDIVCHSESAGTLKSGKGINVPSLVVGTDPVTARDREMIVFAREIGVDFIGVSFVESADHVVAIQSLVGKGWPRIVSKIETQKAMNCLEEVVKASDAVMIDRGDLSVETGLENIALFQKQILRVARIEGKPAIVATEMLHSMIENPIPTKAEITDISNAVLDGAAAIMLSGETAVGQFPVEAVSFMRRTADAVSNHLQDSMDRENNSKASRVPQAMADAIALVCRQLPVTKIVAITVSGYAARMVAARMPRQPILAVSNDRANARSFNLLLGTEGVYVDIPFSRTSTDHIAQCLKALWQRGKLVDEDMILVTSVGYPRSGNRMNLIQTHYVADLKESLGWR